MKTKVFDLDGTSKSSIELPKVFETEYKPVLIKRSVIAMQTAKIQPKGADQRAGFKTTAIYIGTRGLPTPKRTINTNKARLPRTKNRQVLLSGRVGRVAQSVGGRTPNAPKAWKVIQEKINKKERKLALESAIATTAMKELVEKRFIVENDLPIVIEDAFENTKKTKELTEILEKLKIGNDLRNAKSKIRKRAGKGKARGRTKKVKKSVLIITGSNKPVLKAARNLPGVDSVTVTSLNVELLAPGAEAGRLVVWTRSAIEALIKKENKKEIVEKKPIKEEKPITKKEKPTIKKEEPKVQKKVKK
ncbi:MAG: 50S ribosomal protein L4 [Candidatus ainarchaeum sp.]|nr:50S ribosomal protein L4 [Candidatus ainarchaeum sp.]